MMQPRPADGLERQDHSPQDPSLKTTCVKYESMVLCGLLVDRNFKLKQSLNSFLKVHTENTKRFDCIQPKRRKKCSSKMKLV